MKLLLTEERQANSVFIFGCAAGERWQSNVSQHDAEEFTLAYNDYRKSLVTYAFFKTNNRTLSEDLVQETFTKAWVHLSKNGKINNMKAFLRHILTHLIIDEYRKRKETSLDTLLETGFDPTINDYARIYDILDGENAILLIQRLPKQYYQILYMRFVEDLSLEEISQSLGATKNSVAVQTHRGLQKLRTLFENSARA